MPYCGWRLVSKKVMIAVMSRNAFCIWENRIRVESRVWQETWKGLYDDSCTQVLYNQIFANPERVVLLSCLEGDQEVWGQEKASTDEMSQIIIIWSGVPRGRASKVIASTTRRMTGSKICWLRHAQLHKTQSEQRSLICFSPGNITCGDSPP